MVAARVRRRRADGRRAVCLTGVNEGVARVVTRIRRHLVQWGADLRQRPGDNSSLLSHLLIFELISVALNNEVGIKLEEPSDDVDSNHDTFHDRDSILAVLEGDIDTRGGSVPNALNDSGGGILREHGVDRENTRCDAKAEVKSQDERKAGDHADVLDEDTDESESAHDTKDGIHDRLDPESNSIALVDRATGTCSTELKETDTSDERAPNHGQDCQNESTESGWQAAEEFAGANRDGHVGSTK